MRSVYSVWLLGSILFTTDARAGGPLVTNYITYASSIDPITNLVGIMYYDSSVTGRMPTITFGHPYSNFQDVPGDNTNAFVGSTNMLTTWASNGWIVCEFAMRGRYTASGTNDDSGREVMDIIDGTTYVQTNWPSLVSGYKVLNGFSGGGGNALNIACKFPDFFNAIIDNFGMSDYGYDATFGWYQQGGAQHTMQIAIGGTPGTVPNAYRSRDAILRIATNFTAGGFLFMFQNNFDSTVTNNQTTRVRDAFIAAGNSNMLCLLSDTSYQHGLATSPPYLSDGFPTWSPTITNAAVPEPCIAPTGFFNVGGYMVTKRFSIWLGGGTNSVADVTYDAPNGNYTVNPLTGSTQVRIYSGPFAVTNTISSSTLINIGSTVAGPTGFRVDPSDYSDVSGGASGWIAHQFRWTNNAVNPTAYQVEVSTNGVDFFLEKTMAGNATAYDSANVPWTSNRWYRIRAVSGQAVSPYSQPLHVVGNMPPTALSGSTANITHMTVNWAAAGGYLDGYMVQMDTNANFTTPWMQQFFVPGIASTTYTITYNFALNTVYYFRVVSHSLGGNSDAMNKPISYLAVAPNGPPVAPSFVTENMDQNVGEANIFFDDLALNTTGWILRYSINGGVTWTTNSPAFTGATRYTVTQTGLTGGATYQYQLYATNSLGLSPPTTWTFVPPATAAGGPWTTWYVDLNATGNSTGTNWANAWESLGAINWPALGPGHVVFISGGNYTNYIITYTDGAYGNPILLKTSTNSPHNGLVSMNGQIAWKSSYVTIDGGRLPSYTPAKAEDTNNINLQVIGRGNDDPGVLTVVARGAVLKFCEVTGNGSPQSGEGSGDGIQVIPNAIGPTNCFFFNCYVHDVFGSALNEITISGYNFPNGVVFGNCYLLNYHNNCFACASAWTATNCFWGGWKAPGVAHPDGVQGGFENSTFANNRMNYNCPSGSAIYMDITGSTSQRNFYFVNNLFYGGTLDMQFAIITAGTPLIISNMWFAGNTFFGTNQASLAFVTGSNTGRVIQASHILNNLFYTGTNGIAGNGGFSSGNTEYAPADLEFNYNILTGTGLPGGGFLAGGKVVSYRTNNTPGIGAAGVCTFNSAELFDAWSPSYKNNTSATNQFEQWEAGDFQLYGADVVAMDKGTNTSTMAFPFSTNDVAGSARGLGAGWDIGAYEHDPSLVLYYNFESLTNGRGGWIEDRSGHLNHGWSVTNATIVNTDGNYCPTNTLGIVGNFAGNFRLKGTNEQFQRYGANLGYQIGDFFGITNWNGIDFLTNGTWACWVEYTNLVGIGDSTLWSGEYINSPADDNTWAISAYANGFEALARVTNGTRVDRVQFGTGPALPTNQWMHLAVTWSGTNNTAVGYTNGVPFVTNALLAPYLHLANESHNVIVGAMTFGVDYTMQNGHPNNGWFTGYLDEMRIYNRQLSGSEISALVAGTSAASGSGSVSDPAITVQPQNQTVTAPAAATFSVTASGQSALSYQWSKNGTSIAGATQASYTTPATSYPADNGSTFYVVVTDTAGSLQSSTATLTVNPVGGLARTGISFSGGINYIGTINTQ